MGQKICPISLRIGITENWRSRWYADKKHFGDYVVEDEKIRRYIKKEYDYAGISKIEIERSRDELNIHIFSARPGLIIGRKGIEVERLQKNLQNITDEPVQISVEEVTEPELDAQLVAEQVAQELERRSSFRRTMKNTIEMTMDAGAKGVRVQVSGRLGGSEIARSVHDSEGSIPLHTLKAQIDYGFAESRTKYGSIGVKVWINKGELAPGETISEESSYGENAEQS